MSNNPMADKTKRLRRIKQKRIEARVCLDPFLCPELICAVSAATKKIQNQVLTDTNKCSKL